MGATDGVIMPTIITDHMANMKTKSAGAQALKAGSSGPLAAPMSMPAISSTGRRAGAHIHAGHLGV